MLIQILLLLVYLVLLMVLLLLLGGQRFMMLHGAAICGIDRCCSMLGARSSLPAGLHHTVLIW